MRYTMKFRFYGKIMHKCSLRLEIRITQVLSATHRLLIIDELTPTNMVKIREGANGVRTAIVRVPLAPGLKLARLKKLRVGWANAALRISRGNKAVPSALPRTILPASAKVRRPGGASDGGSSVGSLHTPTPGCKIRRDRPRPVHPSAGRTTTAPAMPAVADSTPWFKVLQVNLNHCWAAQQLLLQTVAELSVDVIIVCDYYRPLEHPPQWVDSTDGKCAIYIPNRSAAIVSDHGCGQGFAWAKVGDKLVYSCNCTPNCTIDEFDNFLSGLEESIAQQAVAGIDLVVAGDFNAHSAKWGSSSEDARDSLLFGLASALNLTVCNEGSIPTYRQANAASVIDVTFARSSDNRPLVRSWAVLEQQYSGSDHEYIAYTVLKSEQARYLTETTRPGGWSVKKLSTPGIEEHWDRVGKPPALPPHASTEEHAERLQSYLTQACNAAMPVRSAIRGKKAVHWWSD
uniref:Endonuclease/exonuclease/phosphatase domain-containing protein n=1 Tax=Sipha flava TaxID=143950 RepID=A0A2S2PYS4_9HEMI